MGKSKSSVVKRSPLVGDGRSIFLSRFASLSSLSLRLSLSPRSSPLLTTPHSSPSSSLLHNSVNFFCFATIYRHNSPASTVSIQTGLQLRHFVLHINQNSNTKSLIASCLPSLGKLRNSSPPPSPLRMLKMKASTLPIPFTKATTKLPLLVGGSPTTADSSRTPSLTLRESTTKTSSSTKMICLRSIPTQTDSSQMQTHQHKSIPSSCTATAATVESISTTTLLTPNFPLVSKTHSSSTLFTKWPSLQSATRFTKLSKTTISARISPTCPPHLPEMRMSAPPTHFESG
ncbi:hypothetical protein DL95DRAFT_171889 [Leptodontidium sp. 2 PMI_412]|nr:hypothetical protein DL95DRAFT_171889 [Leptodontidium sp. 2 PMI_412]